MKHVLAMCIVLMLIGACIGGLIWGSGKAAFACSLAGLGATIAALWLLGTEPSP